jgi:hypothetical protein
MTTSTRGSYKFEIDDRGHLLDAAANVERLRRLWLDRSTISGEALGPGDPGDFDHGAWHVACHLLAGAGVHRLKNGELAWLEVSHNSANDRYYGSVTSVGMRHAQAVRLDSAEGRSLLEGSTLMGFVEGSSLGRTSARSVTDPPTLFNLWQRQDFDRPPGDQRDGGRVWEHWCTLRDIRQSHLIGTSVLTAYVSLVAALGDLFIPTVARGRRTYGHPQQLCAMVRAGLVAEESALWNGQPTAVPANLETLLEAAEPGISLRAARDLDWSNPPRYYMFARKIAAWSKAAEVAHDLEQSR